VGAPPPYSQGCDPDAAVLPTNACCRQYSKAYVPLEDAARTAGKGIWSGSFEVPQQWRIDNPRGKAAASAAAAPSVAAAAAAVAAPPPAAPAKPPPTVAAAKAPAATVAAAAAPAAAAAAPVAAPPSGCLVKGNMTAKGERIYHLPGGSFYERTIIEEGKGERFFCSAAEAEAAGWRASRS
jgi:hypothetical protein